jgi:hypothetical protein
VEDGDRYVETLRLASACLGEGLSERLGVQPAQLNAWLSGSEPPTLDAFLIALDVIADGPFASRRRPPRVAVLPEKTPEH